LFALVPIAASVPHDALHQLPRAAFPNGFNGPDPSRPRSAASPSTAALVFSLIFTSAAAAFAAPQRAAFIAWYRFLDRRGMASRNGRGNRNLQEFTMAAAPYRMFGSMAPAVFDQTTSSS
jgi:hypothetical protein